MYTPKQHFSAMLVALTCVALVPKLSAQSTAGEAPPRERISIDDSWRFKKYGPGERRDGLIYDVRPAAPAIRDVAEVAKPVEAAGEQTAVPVLKAWVLPTGNDFIKEPTMRFARPKENPAGDFSFAQADYDDRSWKSVDLPHDWAIKGPYYQGEEAPVGGGMGRLPSPGVAWYRKKLAIPANDAGKSIFLDVDGAMSYAMVWVNGKLAGGWPYGYASWRVDLTPFLVPGGENQLAIRLDNPPNSSRWYPGGGIYRNVWLVKTQPVHVAHWGTRLTTPQVSATSATIDLTVTVDNDSKDIVSADVETQIFALDNDGKRAGDAVTRITPASIKFAPGTSAKAVGSCTLDNPKLWGPPPTQHPNLYLAVTSVSQQGKLVDRYETRFGVRSITLAPDKGMMVNGERIFVQGVNQHHDLGALGAAFNTRAAERQLQLLQEMGCNAIRTAHNPPAPELLELTDRMGILVLDEIFDTWEQPKTPLDFHLIFPEWHEQDLRAMIRRDRNSPSVFMWSYGNEVGEQDTGEKGAAIAQQLHDIASDEDSIRPATASLNAASPDAPFSAVGDVIGLNYQGEGMRDTPPYAGLKGRFIQPEFDAFHEKFPRKAILDTENSAVLSSRGEYMFPVPEPDGVPWKDSRGEGSEDRQVSAYGLCTDQFGATAGRVFAAQDQHPFVGGGFVWSGWDYLGEPVPYDSSRSSYYGIIDLAGFKKDLFYLYQSHWRPDLPMAHILPHWTWPERLGKVTPVHIFTSGDEAELFLNGKSLGRKKKGKDEYRLRWDEVKYKPGELKVIAYKNGAQWATDVIKTAGEPSKLELLADRSDIRANGQDLSFVTVRVTDEHDLTAPRARNAVSFKIDGPGEIVATDNGDPTNLIPFPASKPDPTDPGSIPSIERKAFNGYCVVIVRGKPGADGPITLRAEADGLAPASVKLKLANL